MYETQVKSQQGAKAPIRFDVDRIPAQYTVKIKNKVHLLSRDLSEEESPKEFSEDMKS